MPRGLIAADAAGTPTASRLVRRRLIAADLAGISLAFVAAWLLFDAPLLVDGAAGASYALLPASLPAWAALARAGRLYRTPAREPLWEDLRRVAGLMTICACVVAVAAYAAGKHDPDVGQLFAFWCLAIAAMVLGRGAARAVAPDPRRAALGQVRRRLRRPPFARIAVDGVALLAAFALGWLLAQEPRPDDSTVWGWAFVAVSLPVWAFAAALCGHYSGRANSLGRDLRGVARLAIYGAWALLVLSPFTGENDADVGQLLVVWALTVAAVTLGRRAVARGRGARAPRRSPSG